MFGLNDNENKTDNAASETVSSNGALASIDSGLSSVGLPPNDSQGQITNPIVAPGSDPIPAPIPSPPLEAVPAAPAPIENIAQFTAEATMPELVSSDPITSAVEPIKEEPKVQKSRKKSKHHHDDTPAPLAATANEDELLDIKQQALKSLTPLVDELDQTPEEKFKTVMMLIQASDNSEMVKEAYVAANEITDEKARAQALLDVVNEINYFTQHQQDSAAIED